MKEPMHFPLALKKNTNELVHISEVSNGLSCDCFCAACGEDLIAANNGLKQTPHFRHSKESNCAFIASFETYVHWLAKAIFDSLESINFPAVNTSSLDLSLDFHRHLVAKVKDRLKKEGILEDINENEISFFNKILQKPFEAIIENRQIEQTKQSEYGAIRVDIVLKINGEEIFIEPYYSNKIDKIKLGKIKSFDVSTISINLFPFIKKYGPNFTLDQLEIFIQKDITTKEWVYIKNEKFDIMMQSLFNQNFEDKLLALKKNISMYRDLQFEIDRKTERISELRNEILKLQDVQPSKSILNLFN